MSKVVEAAISIGPWFNSNIFALTYGEKGSDVDVYGLANDAIAGAHYCRYISSVTLAVQPCIKISEDMKLQYKHYINEQCIEEKGWSNIIWNKSTGSHSADTQECILEETPIILAYQFKDMCNSNLIATIPFLKKEISIYNLLKDNSAVEQCHNEKEYHHDETIKQIKQFSINPIEYCSNNIEICLLTAIAGSAVIVLGSYLAWWYYPILAGGIGRDVLLVNGQVVTQEQILEMSRNIPYTALVGGVNAIQPNDGEFYEPY
jgi:hypothetical protein